VLKTAHNVLNYEEVTPKSATATITITDGVDTASQPLRIVIRNVNEAPYFHQTKYTLEVPEEGAVSIFFIKFKVTIQSDFKDNCGFSSRKHIVLLHILLFAKHTDI
jgi:hypothetical protein